MAELRADIELLLECMRCQLDNPDAIKQALLTTASMFSTMDGAKDTFRECGGLKFVFELATSTPHAAVKMAAMFLLGCAVEHNVPSQKVLSTSGTFLYLNGCLTSRRSSPTQKQTATFLILYLVANNSLAQMHVRKSNCLQTLLILFKSCLPSSDSTEEGSGWFDAMAGPQMTQSMKLWSAVTSALSVCVNNPQNDENQRACASVYPQGFRFLQENADRAGVVRSICYLLQMTVAGNVHNQDRVFKCGGLPVLIDLLHRAVNRFHDDTCPKSFDTALCVVQTLGVCATDSGAATTRCCSLGLLELLLKMLQLDGKDEDVQTQLVVLMARCIDGYPESRHSLVANGAPQILLKIMGETRNEDLIQAAKYILQTCLATGQPPDSHSSTKAATGVYPADQLSFQAHAVPQLSQSSNEPPAGLSQTPRATGDARRASSDSNSASGPGKYEMNDDISKRLGELEKMLNMSLSGQKEIQKKIDKETDEKVDKNCQKNEEENRKLRKELRQERLLRRQLEKGAADAQKALEDRIEDERKAAERTKALEEELEKQACREDEDERKIKQMVEQSYKEHQELMFLKKQKEDELQTIQVKLESIKCRLNESLVSNMDESFDAASAIFEPPRTLGSKTQRKLLNVEDVKKHLFRDSDNKYDIGEKASKIDYDKTSLDQGICHLGSVTHDTDVITGNDKIPELVSDIDQFGDNEPAYHLMEVSTQTLHTIAGPREQIPDVHNVKQVRRCDPSPIKVKDDDLSVSHITEYEKTNAPCTGDKPRMVAVAVQTPEIMSITMKATASAKRKAVHQSDTLSRKCRETVSQHPAPSNALKAQSETLKTHTLGPGGDATPASRLSGFAYPGITPTVITSTESGYSSHGDIKGSCMHVRNTKDRNPTRNMHQEAGPQECPSSESRIQAPGLKKGIDENSTGNIIKTKPVQLTLAQTSKLLTPSRGCKEESVEVFVKPQMPLSVRRRRGVFMNSQNTPLSMKNMSMVSGSSDFSRCKPIIDNVRNGMKPRECNVPSSPALSVCSEFDTLLLNKAKPGNNSVRVCKVRRWLQEQQTPLKRGRITNEPDEEDMVSVCSDVLDREADCISELSFSSRITNTIRNTQCPACQPPATVHGPLLNSRTYNIVMETSHSTCTKHRAIRQRERLYIHKAIKMRKGIKSIPSKSRKLSSMKPTKDDHDKTDVYEFRSSPSEESEGELHRPLITPPHDDQSSGMSLETSVSQRDVTRRRKRIPYSDQEVANLQEGVRKMGRFWHQILNTYEFHPRRTALDLQDKYKSMMKSMSPSSVGPSRRCKQPFSMVEERRLRRGVRKFGYNWKVIVESMTFAEGRTSAQLRSKWRTMHKC